MLQIFNQKYPAPKPGIRGILVAILFGLFIALFLVFFEPFDIDLSARDNQIFQLLFFGCITTLVLLVFLYILPLTLPQLFSDTNWTVKHQILFYFVILFLIATFNGVYTNYINSLSFSWYNYWWIISRTFVLGGIPIAFLTLLDYQRKFNLNRGHAHTISSNRKKSVENQNEIIRQISTDLKNETITFKEEAFNYAVAVGNYIDVYTTHEKNLKKATYRISLSSFQAQLEESENLKRCHRSYFVNLSKVENISGNAQGLRLKLKNKTEPIPVSRKYIPAIRQFFTENK